MKLASKETLDRAVATITIVSALVGGGWALKEYIENNHAAEVKQSLQFYDETIDSRYEIPAAIDYISKKFENTRAERSVLGDRQEERYIIAMVNSDATFRASVLTITDFYDSLYYCTQNGACDADTAVGLFGAQASAFWGNLFSWLYCERTLSRFGRPFADGLEFFAIEYAVHGKNVKQAAHIRSYMQSDKIDCFQGWEKFDDIAENGLSHH